MDQKADRRARRGMPMADILGYRQDCFLACERLAQNVGKESRRRLVGRPGRMQMVGSRMPMPSMNRGANNRASNSSPIAFWVP